MFHTFIDYDYVYKITNIFCVFYLYIFSNKLSGFLAFCCDGADMAFMLNTSIYYIFIPFCMFKKWLWLDNN